MNEQEPLSGAPQLFYKDGPFGTRDEFCEHIAETLHIDVQSLQNMTHQDVYDLLDDLRISTSVCMSRHLSEEEFESWKKEKAGKILTVPHAGYEPDQQSLIELCLMTEAISKITREPDPLSPREIKAIKKLREEFRKIDGEL